MKLYLLTAACLLSLIVASDRDVCFSSPKTSLTPLSPTMTVVSTPVSSQTLSKTPRSHRRILWSLPQRVFLSPSVKNGLASGLSTMFVKALLQPFDTIKTMQHLHPTQSLVVTTQKIVRSRGVTGLWTGTLVSAVFSAPSNAIYFGLYSALRKDLVPLLPPHLRIVAIAVAAMISNAIAAVFRVPSEVTDRSHSACVCVLTFVVGVERWWKWLFFVVVLPV
jgi:hypothetical protein